MTRFVLGRVAQMAVTLLGASVVVFTVLRLMPGDPALVYAGPFAGSDVVEAVRDRMGLHDPLPVQYLLWLKAFVTGDLGVSSISGLPVSQLVGSALAQTALLTLTTSLLAIGVGVPLGLLAALRKGTWADRLVAGFNTVALGVPNFWLGLILVIVFAINFSILPAGGSAKLTEDPLGALTSLVLPTIALGLAPAAMLARLTRGAVIEVMHEDFMTMAAAKGMSIGFVIRRSLLRHVFLNLLPVLAILVGSLLTGAAIIESVFTLPGAGRLIIESTRQRDYAVLQTLLVIFVAVFLLVTFVADILYSVLDPRVRGHLMREGGVR
ncbi:MAG: ABC transporter permease [Nocardioidaceae bacterium]|nr:ABC transporter permease [Nocardioidaceae bacterium]